MFSFYLVAISFPSERIHVQYIQIFGTPDASNKTNRWRSKENKYKAKSNTKVKSIKTRKLFMSEGSKYRNTSNGNLSDIKELYKVIIRRQA